MTNYFTVILLDEKSKIIRNIFILTPNFDYSIYVKNNKKILFNKSNAFDCIKLNNQIIISDFITLNRQNKYKITIKKGDVYTEYENDLDQVIIFYLNELQPIWFVQYIPEIISINEIKN